MRNRLHLVIALATLGVASPVAAQAPDVSPGIQFAGCWTASDAMATKARTCVIPANGMLRLVTVDRDGATSESSLRLDGERTPLASEGCSGWEQARLTRDGERVIIDAEVACGNDPKQRVQTAFSITPVGYFLQTSGKGFGMIPNAGLRLFVPVETYVDIPAAARADVMRYIAEGERARMRIRDNKLTAGDLVELEEMGVVAPVLDVVVASAYPKSFVIDATGGFAETQLVASDRDPSRFADRNCGSAIWMNGYPMMSMYDWDLMYNCGCYSAGCPMGYRGYSRLAGYGYGYGYGYGGYGYGYGYGPFGGYLPGYGYPVVVVRPVPGGGAPANGGRAVRGRGYTETGSTTGSGAQPRSSVSPSSASGRDAGSSSAGSSGSSSAGSSSSGGSSSGEGARTAKPRSP